MRETLSRQPPVSINGLSIASPILYRAQRQNLTVRDPKLWHDHTITVAGRDCRVVGIDLDE
jgi:hypothetical protein